MFLIVGVTQAHAAYYNNVTFYSSGLNSTINVSTSLNASNVITDTNYIYFDNLTDSRADWATNEGISFNFTEENLTYPAVQLPYIYSSTITKKVIKSLLAADLSDVTVYLDVNRCDVSGVSLVSASNTYDGTVSAYSCANNRLEVNLSGLEYGFNTVYLAYNGTLSNCTGGNVTLEFSVFHEDIPTRSLNATADVLITYWNNTQFKTNWSHSYEGNSTYKVCIEPVNASLNADVFIEYNVTGGYTHRYYLLNTSLTNSSRNITLFNFNSTSTTETLKLTAVNENYEYFSGLYVKMLRFYPASNLWRVVQMDKADDFARSYFHVRETDTNYKFIFQSYNTTLKTTDQLHFYCPTTDDCVLTVIVDSSSSSTAFNAYAWDYDTTTKIFNITWNDITGDTDQITLQAWSEASNGRVLWCNTTVATAAGTINCNLSSATGAVWVTAFRTASPLKPLFLEFIEDPVTYFYDALTSSGLQSEGLLFGTFISAAIILAGAFNAITLLISVPLGFIVTYLFGFANFITVTFIVVASVMALVLGVLIKRQ